LDFQASPFNEVDAAVLSILGYIHMEGIVPGCESGAGVSLKEASAWYFSKFSTAGEKPEPGTNAGPRVSPTILPSFNAGLDDLLEKLSGCPRFERVRLSRLDQDTDFSVGRQFAALTFTLPDARPEHVVVFRGTDSTLVGWKEDFELVYMEQIPAQDSALRYLEQTLDTLPGRFIVCGHSKGGNLAVYAGLQIGPAAQDRISKIYNFDGPGFDFSVVDRVPFNHYGFKVLNIVPEESMVGMLLEPVGKRAVVASSARLASQHSAFQWTVERTEFSRGNLAAAARLLDRILKTWLTKISLSEREAFLEALFDLLGASEGASISLDPLHNMKEIRKVLQNYSRLDKETKSLLNQTFGSLSTHTTRTVSTTIRQRLPGKQDLIKKLPGRRRSLPGRG